MLKRGATVLRAYSERNGRLGYTVKGDWLGMRGEGIKIGRINGIPIYLHPSWFLIFALIVYSFVSEFDSLHLNIPAPQLW
ncbi:MAG: hypothetical protein ACRD4Y_12355, partial [Candidatus Acidiferrales bacterium]